MKKTGGKAVSEGTVYQVRLFFSQSHIKSLQRLSNELGISQKKLWKTLRKHSSPGLQGCNTM
jgi:biotin operon repressor